MKVGFAGLGRMGGAMAPRLIDAGFELHVWNRTRARAEALAARGAKVAATPGALAEAAEVVISMLTEDAGVEALFTGPDGFLAGPVEGKLFVEMSTLRPATVRALAARVGAAGARFVDAPVMGTVAPAREGKLLAMAGGSAEDVERARPVLAQLTRKIVPMGPVGSGATMKLVMNLGLALYLEALAEGLALGARGGLETGAMLDVIADGPVAAPILNLKMALLRGGEGPPAFDIAGLRKDLLSALSTASATGVPMPAASGALAAFSAACAAGWDGRDIGELPRFFRENMPQKPSF
jgi:3-hydroxyisobutyrate dehydrogenase